MKKINMRKINMKKILVSVVSVSLLTGLLQESIIAVAEEIKENNTVLLSSNTEVDRSIPNVDFNNDGGYYLSPDKLNSTSLVNPYRDYKYRFYGEAHDVLSVENIDGIFDYVEMDPISNGYSMPDYSHLKYLVIHETGLFSAGSWSMNNFSYFTKSEENATFIVDDNTVVKAMELTDICYAVGNTDPEKSDVFNQNSISIEMCVNSDGNYLKTVANTVFLSRGIINKIPQLKLRQHADAWSEGRNDMHPESAQKNCPEVLRGETTWWTWERFCYFVENSSLPIPYIDFDPTVEDEVPNELREYLGFPPKNETLNETLKEESKATELSEYISRDSIFIKNNLSESDMLEFDRYIEMDSDFVFDNIKSKALSLKMSDEELKTLIRSVDLTCKLEKMNPYIVIELMNSYTGYFSYGGQVKKEDNNFGGLKNKDGEFIRYSSINEGVIAFTQYIKTLSSKTKLKLKSENKDALKCIKKNSVDNFADLSKALDVSDKFIESVINRVLSY